MSNVQVTNRYISLSLILVTIFWFFLFYLKLTNFWLGMSIVTFILLLISIRKIDLEPVKKQINIKNIGIGVASAIILYLVFVIGNWISGYIPGGNENIASVYNLKDTGNIQIISILLIFPITLGEEFFWRGLIQKKLSNNFGSLKGYLITSVIYSGVHIWSFNVMLILAALVAGLWWGYIFKKTNNLVIVLVSHAIWSLSIFVLFPVS